MWKWIRHNILYIALGQAIIATASSLYLSLVIHLNPCVLCWYQRILMYPLVIVIAAGIWKKSRDMEYFVLPFTIIGLVISAYHNLLQYGVVKEKIIQCSMVTPCISPSHGLLGFITVPFLSFAAFTVITACMIIYRKGQGKF